MITPEAEKNPAIWLAQRDERIAMAVQACRDQTRINREEDASIRAGRPSQTLGVDLQQRPKEEHTPRRSIAEIWIAEDEAELAAERAAKNHPARNHPSFTP